MATENSIELKSINDIIALKFFIPSYQRGYRWAEQQVGDLLEDIWEFSQNKLSNDEFYCLQPVIVKELDGKWELIDGQQRLTTIFIILNYFNHTQFKTAKKVFELEFETRADSQTFLKDIDIAKKEINIDYFHICNANDKISSWFAEKEKLNPAIANEFYPVLINYTKIIWYQINDGSDPREIFTRINLGKIPLTNAELIKALFLRSDNFGNNPDKVRLKQLEIASEWDRIEYTLQNDEFWYFINKETNELPTRIEFIFNLMSKKNPKYDEYYTFRYFNDKFNEVGKNKIETIWKEIKDYFLTFEEWFTDRELYHLIGYLIATGFFIEEIKSKAENKTKKDFRNYLKDQIKKRIDYKIDELEYKENNPNKSIENILLLFNIETLLQNFNSNYRFPFNTYKGNGISTQKWSLEHIHAQNSKGLDTTDKRKQWLEEVMNTIKDTDVLNEESNEETTIFKEINILLEKDNIELEEFQTVQIKIFSLYGDPELHTIDNLTLLTVSNNSSLNNSIFPVKRNKIIDLEKTGSFIPICTRNIFLKYYSLSPSHLHFWSENDRKDYLIAIKKTLTNYLPIEEILN